MNFLQGSPGGKAHGRFRVRAQARQLRHDITVELTVQAERTRGEFGQGGVGAPAGDLPHGSHSGAADFGIAILQRPPVNCNDIRVLERKTCSASSACRRTSGEVFVAYSSNVLVTCRGGRFIARMALAAAARGAASSVEKAARTTGTAAGPIRLNEYKAEAWTDSLGSRTQAKSTAAAGAALVPASPNA